MGLGRIELTEERLGSTRFLKETRKIDDSKGFLEIYWTEKSLKDAGYTVSSEDGKIYATKNTVAT